jgi:uncharacterized protein YcgI (DUF1989 family)
MMRVTDNDRAGRHHVITTICDSELRKSCTPDAAICGTNS